MMEIAFPFSIHAKLLVFLFCMQNDGWKNNENLFCGLLMLKIWKLMDMSKISFAKFWGKN